jgi:predicted  nucleic acid-binding Zn-ribbon protein
MAAKKESRLALREEKRQRYEQEVDAWQEALREKQDSLDALHGRIKRADVQRKEMAESLSIIEKEKEALLERLRHVVRFELCVLVLERWCLTRSNVQCV